MIVIAQANRDRDLWGSVKKSLDDCERTLGKLSIKLDELQAGSFFGRGFLRKPTKAIKMNMNMKEIGTFRQQLHSHNSGMQSALSMISVWVFNLGRATGAKKKADI